MSDFIKHLENSSEIVKNWPIWKQNVLGNKMNKEQNQSSPDQPLPKQSTGDCWKNLIERYSEDNVYNTNLYKEIRLEELVNLNRLMVERRKIGIERYNTVLQPFNGRDCVRDLIEEQLDSLAYSEQVILEYPELIEIMLEWQKFAINNMSKLISFKENGNK